MQLLSINLIKVCLISPDRLLGKMKKFDANVFMHGFTFISVSEKKLKIFISFYTIAYLTAFPIHSPWKLDRNDTCELF